MAEDMPLFTGLSPVDGKAVRVAFDGGRLAGCIEDPRRPDRIVHDLASMIRFRALMIAAGYADANDCERLRTDPAFKLAVGRLPESGRDLCSQPTMTRLENLPSRNSVHFIMTMVGFCCFGLYGPA